MSQDTTLPPLPNVPKEILTLIHAYGDERADESMTWAEHYRELIAALREWGAAIAAQAQQAQGVAAGMVLVPLRMTQAMRDVAGGEDWQWEDLLAAAEAITEEEYDQLAAAPQAAPAPQAETDQHPDNKAVDRFAARMKWKLGQKRRQGRSGWQDRAWTPEMISQALREHVNKGDPLDVANYCMFLAARNEPITPAPAPQALTERDPLTDAQLREVILAVRSFKIIYPTDIALARGVERAMAERWGIKLADIGTKGGKP